MCMLRASLLACLPSCARAVALYAAPFKPRAAAYVTGAVLIGFLLHPVHHVDPAWFAILGAIVL